MKKKHAYWFVLFFLYYFLLSCAATVTQFPSTGIRIWSAITIPDSLSRGTHDGPKGGNIQNNHQLQQGESGHIFSVLAEGERWMVRVGVDSMDKTVSPFYPF